MSFYQQKSLLKRFENIYGIPLWIFTDDDCGTYTNIFNDIKDGMNKNHHKNLKSIEDLDELDIETYEVQTEIIHAYHQYFQKIFVDYYNSFVGVCKKEEEYLQLCLKGESKGHAVTKYLKRKYDSQSYLPEDLFTLINFTGTKDIEVSKKFWYFYGKCPFITSFRFDDISLSDYIDFITNHVNLNGYTKLHHIELKSCDINEITLDYLKKIEEYAIKYAIPSRASFGGFNDPQYDGNIKFHIECKYFKLSWSYGIHEIEPNIDCDLEEQDKCHDHEHHFHPLLSMSFLDMAHYPPSNEFKQYFKIFSIYEKNMYSMKHYDMNSLSMNYIFDEIQRIKSQIENQNVEQENAPSTKRQKLL